MDKKARIRNDIERKRDEMNKASVSHGISSKIVLKISQELDKLLNKYHHIQQ
ncbi:aspartyl-phosphate phosphatase Spo0E family protein [Paenibacillus sp. MMO-177]|uniref:aspartyl-phosphate phosphatase Spo0E family protein n=1 Tax=Paenibacillus sp. MMO-177 TaxID=3081289 RepID=UPI003016DB77